MYPNSLSSASHKRSFICFLTCIAKAGDEVASFRRLLPTKIPKTDNSSSESSFFRCEIIVGVVDGIGGDGAVSVRKGAVLALLIDKVGGGGAFRRFVVTDGSFSGGIGSSMADGISLFTISSGDGDRDLL